MPDDNGALAGVSARGRRPSRHRTGPVHLLGMTFWRFQAALFLLGGLTGIAAAFHEPPGLHRWILVGLAAVHLASSAALCCVAAARRQRLAGSLLLPVVFLAVATGQGVASSQPATFATLSILGFVWVGATRERWSSLRLSPLLAGGCSLIVWSHGITVPALVEAAVGVAVAVIAGEMLSWITSCLLDSDAALRGQDARFRSLVQHSSDVVVVCEPDTTIAYQSPSAFDLLGHGPDTLVGTRLCDLVHPENRGVFVSVTAELLGRSEPGHAAVTSRWQQADGTWRHMAAVITNLLDDPDVAGLVVNSRDVTEQVGLQAELTRQAFTDSLTGLANRALFADRVGHAVAGAGRRAEVTAVLLLDLDDFKVVNDTLGHHAGDEVLKVVAQRLQSTVRSGDTAARLGGDEFAILLDAVVDSDEATGMARRVIAVLDEPVTVDGQEVTVRASIGIAMRANAETPEELLRNADVAMSVAKAAGGGAVVFEEAMHERLTSRLRLESDLRHALRRDEFEVHYQPVVDLQTQHVVGAEALVRWRHPERGLLAPDSFLAVAEETGLIVPLGRHVLEVAAHQAQSWRTAGVTDAEFSIAVNVSARQLGEPDLASDVDGVLARSGLPPGALLLEITESVLLQEDDATMASLHQLRGLGVRLAIDDFGTGYSSLSYLRRLPIDVLKIDKSFVDDVVGSTQAEAVVRTIVSLSEALHLETIAEGVEDTAQLQALRCLGSTRAQGYHFSRPLPVAEMGRLLATGEAAYPLPAVAESP